MKRIVARCILLCVILGAMILTLGSSAVYSQFIPCNIVNLAINSPDTVQAGQTLTVATAVTGSCDPSMSYVIRVDFVDARSSKVLSTVSLPYYPVASSFTTVPLVNTATAPNTLGNWVVQVQVYMISGMNGQTAASSSRQFVITVVPYTPSSVTAQPVTTSSTTSISSTSLISNSTAEVIASVTSTTVESSTPSLVGSYATNTVYVAAVAAIVIVLLAILMMKRNKKESAGEAQVKGNFCGHCGHELSGNGEFCPYCGSKQT